MKAFEVRRSISAPPQAVWDILTDTEALQRNDLGIIGIEGSIALSSKLKIWSEASPGRAFALKVTEFQPPSRMVWSGGMPFGLFTGARRFQLSPKGDQTEFFMREEFAGLLSGLIGKSIPDLQPSFEKFADGLKRLSEGDEH